MVGGHFLRRLCLSSLQRPSSDCSLSHNNCLIRRILSVKLVRLGAKFAGYRPSESRRPPCTTSSSCRARRAVNCKHPVFTTTVLRNIHSLVTSVLILGRINNFERRFNCVPIGTGNTLADLELVAQIMPFLSVQCISSIGQIIKSVCVSVSQSVTQTS